MGQFPIANIAYNGGAREIYHSGEYPTVKSTIEPQLIPLLHVSGHFPGYWGDYTQVWHYPYITSNNGTSFNVNCYCIRFQQCSCDKQYSKRYFDNLPAKVAVQEKFDNLTRVYVNGTEPRQRSQEPNFNSHALSAKVLAGSAVWGLVPLSLLI